MKYVLFGNFISPYSYMIYATLLYKQLDFEYKHVDLAKQEQKTPEYLKMNPMGQIPLLLTTNNQPIFESNAIFEYLEDTHKKYNLLPHDNYERSIVRSLCCILAGSIIPIGRNLFIERLGRISLSNDQRAEYQKQLFDKFHILEQLINKHHSIVTIDNQFMYLFYQTWYNMILGYPEIKIKCPGIEKYHNNISKNIIIKQIENIKDVQSLRNKLYLTHK